MKSRHAFKKDNMKKGIYILPNLFTQRPFFGFYSIISSMNGHFEIAAVSILAQPFSTPSTDGYARITNTTINSAPNTTPCPIWWPSEWPRPHGLHMVPFLLWEMGLDRVLSVCGLWRLRLARFNIQIGIIESKVFNGLPIPGAACTIAATC